MAIAHASAVNPAVVVWIEEQKLRDSINPCQLLKS
jgi:hypothetical protein